LYLPKSHRAHLIFTLFILNFLQIDKQGHSAADRHWPPETSRNYVMVKWRDPLTNTWYGPDPVYGDENLFVFFHRKKMLHSGCRSDWSVGWKRSLLKILILVQLLMMNVEELWALDPSHPTLSPVAQDAFVFPTMYSGNLSLGLPALAHFDHSINISGWWNLTEVLCFSFHENSSCVRLISYDRSGDFVQGFALPPPYLQGTQPSQPSTAFGTCGGLLNFTIPMNTSREVPSSMAHRYEDCPWMWASEKESLFPLQLPLPWRWCQSPKEETSFSVSSSLTLKARDFKNWGSTGTSLFADWFLCNKYTCLDFRPFLFLRDSFLFNSSCEWIGFNYNGFSEKVVPLSPAPVCVTFPFVFLVTNSSLAAEEVNCSSEPCLLSPCWHGSSSSAVLLRVPFQHRYMKDIFSD
jgi:hypothetical protein